MCHKYLYIIISSFTVIIHDLDSGSLGEVSFTVSDDHFKIIANADNKSAVIHVAQ